ncbi:MAG: hypothetical protein J4473_00530 [Candidatus Aenigmarchaeota archaeon]|nr:hypothetical protein [Candidatus Aenigmarchaeota archaeon]
MTSLKCPVCHIMKNSSTDLAKHMIMPSAYENIDIRHKDFIKSNNLRNKELKPLAELLERIAERVGNG